MGAADIIIIAAVVAACALCVRYLVRSNKDGCSDCGSAGTCSAHANGGHCSAAEDMLAHADAALGSSLSSRR